jgi:hypothetical protein
VPRDPQSDRGPIRPFPVGLGDSLRPGQAARRNDAPLSGRRDARCRHASGEGMSALVAKQPLPGSVSRSDHATCKPVRGMPPQEGLAVRDTPQLHLSRGPLRLTSGGSSQACDCLRTGQPGHRIIEAAATCFARGPAHLDNVAAPTSVRSAAPAGRLAMAAAP